MTRIDNTTHHNNNDGVTNVFAAVMHIAPLSPVFAVPTLQDDEAHQSVQVDLLIVPLQEGCCPGQAAQDVVDHLRLRRPHCGTQSHQGRGQLQPREPHVASRSSVKVRYGGLEDDCTTWGRRSEEALEEHWCDVRKSVIMKCWLNTMRLF